MQVRMMHKILRMALSMPLRINTVRESAVIRQGYSGTYFDTDFKGTAKEGDCVLRDKLFKGDEIGTL